MGTTWKFSDTTGRVLPLERLALHNIKRPILGELKKYEGVSRNVQIKAQKELERRQQAERQRLKRAGNAARSIIILAEFNPLLRPEFNMRVELLKTELYTNPSVSDKFLEHFDVMNMDGSLYLSKDIMENIAGYDTVLTIAREMFKDA